MLFSPDEKSQKSTIRVDVVSGSGLRWVKAISRSARSLRMEILRVEEPKIDARDGCEEDYDMDLEDLSTMGRTFQDRNDFATDRLPFFSSAKSLLSAAKQNPVGFKTPVVVFRFVNARRGEDPLVDAVYFDRLKRRGNSRRNGGRGFGEIRRC